MNAVVPVMSLQCDADGPLGMFAKRVVEAMDKSELNSVEKTAMLLDMALTMMTAAGCTEEQTLIIVQNRLRRIRFRIVAMTAGGEG